MSPYVWEDKYHNYSYYPYKSNILIKETNICMDVYENGEWHVYANPRSPNINYEHRLSSGREKDLELAKQRAILVYEAMFKDLK